MSVRQMPFWRRAFTIATCAAATFGCAILKKDAKVNYRVTVAIDGPEGKVRGSGVWSWRLEKPTAALATPYSGKFEGEAIPIELRGGRVVYAILRGRGGSHDMASMMPERVFGDIGRSFRGQEQLHANDRVADLRDIAGRVGERAEVPCDEHPSWCPMLVEFASPGRAESVRRFDPAPGRRVTVSVEITDDVVTRGIIARLPWLPNYYDKMFDGSMIRKLGEGLPNSLSSGDFSKGL